MVSVIKRPKHHIPRPIDDHYPTPWTASIPFLEAEMERSALDPRIPIWEPACGDGALCRALAYVGLPKVHATTLVDRGYGKTGIDFLSVDHLQENRIVTNPPWRDDLDMRFVLHALDLGAEYIAMFLRTAFIAGIERYETLLKPHPPSIIYQFVERIIIYSGDTAKEDQPGWNNTEFCWIVWDRDLGKNEPIIRWLRRGPEIDPDQGKLF